MFFGTREHTTMSFLFEWYFSLVFHNKHYCDTIVALLKHVKNKSTWYSAGWVTQPNWRCKATCWIVASWLVLEPPINRGVNWYSSRFYKELVCMWIKTPDPKEKGNSYFNIDCSRFWPWKRDWTCHPSFDTQLFELSLLQTPNSQLLNYFQSERWTMCPDHIRKFQKHNTTHQRIGFDHRHQAGAAGLSGSHLQAASGSDRKWDLGVRQSTLSMAKWKQCTFGYFMPSRYTSAVSRFTDRSGGRKKESKVWDWGLWVSEINRIIF